MQIGKARAQQAELQSTADSAPASAPDAAAPTAAETPIAAGNDPKAVAGTVQSLLAPDLAVQASLAGSSIETRQGATGGSEAETLRLRAAQVYRGL